MFVFADILRYFSIYIYLHTHGNISNIIYLKQVEIMVSFTSVSPSCCNNWAGNVMIWLHGRSFDNTQRAPGWLIFKDRYSFQKEKGFVILLILLTISGGFWKFPFDFRNSCSPARCPAQFDVTFLGWLSDLWGISKSI